MEYVTSPEEIGIRIKKCRKTAGMTQAEVAEAMNLSINYVSELENGKKNMSTLTVASLCQCFDRSADFFLFGKEEKEAFSNTNDLIEYVSSLPEEQLENLESYIASLRSLKQVMHIDKKNG